MGALLISFILLLITQLALGLRAFFHKQALSNRFDYILSDLPDPATVLEKYMRIYRKIGIRVNAQIVAPAFAYTDFILVRRDQMYFQDLYTNFYVLTQLELTKKTYTFLRNVFGIQNILFYSGVVMFIVALFMNSNTALILMIIAVVFHVVTIVFAIISFELYAIAMEEAIFVAQDLLNLDDLELARTKQLAQEFKYRVFEYPFDIPIKLISFFSF